MTQGNAEWGDTVANEYENLSRDPEFLRTLRQEELILEVTEALTRALDDSGLRKVDLAERLGKSKGFVSQLLSGGRNLTLRTVSDVALALGLRPRLKLCSESEGRYVMSAPLNDWKSNEKIVRFPFPVRYGASLHQEDGEPNQASARIA